MESKQMAQARPPGSVHAARLVGARAVWLLHVAVIAFLLAGWALPWPLAWWTYALGAPFIQIGWIVFAIASTRLYLAD